MPIPVAAVVLPRPCNAVSQVKITVNVVSELDFTAALGKLVRETIPTYPFVAILCSNTVPVCASRLRITLSAL